MKSPTNALLAAVVLPGAVLALQDGIGLKPHMGWSSWNVAQCDAASAKYALDTANKFVSLGLKDLGYECKLIPGRQIAPFVDIADGLCRYQH
jgi:alpha-galactosidase